MLLNKTVRFLMVAAKYFINCWFDCVMLFREVSIIPYDGFRLYSSNFTSCEFHFAAAGIEPLIFPIPPMWCFSFTRLFYLYFPDIHYRFNKDNNNHWIQEYDKEQEINFPPRTPLPPKKKIVENYHFTP